MMMQGESFVQKPSSRSLWNVASFSTMRTNLADETISGRESRKMHARPSQTCTNWAKDTSDSTNVWGDCNSLTGVTVDPRAVFLHIAQITWDEAFGRGQLVKKSSSPPASRWEINSNFKKKKKKKKSVESAITNTLLPRVRPCEAPSASRRCHPRYCPQISGSQTAECCCNRCLCGNSTRILMRCLIYSKHHISVFTGAKINLFVANESLCTSL